MAPVPRSSIPSPGLKGIMEGPGICPKNPLFLVLPDLKDLNNDRVASIKERYLEAVDFQDSIP